MLNLYTISTKKENSQENLLDNEKTSILYHDLFDYPLSFPDLIRWKSGKSFSSGKSEFSIAIKRGYYFLDGHEGLIYKRLLRKRISAKKMSIAKRAAKVLSLTPGIKMVAVTGSLAMENSSEESDIDIMIITKAGALWTTRAFVYFALHVFGFTTRKPNDNYQKDKLCLNMWLDEDDLVWKKYDRNAYTSHEIAQIVPLVNKDKTYEKFLFTNKWILSYWPSAVRVQSTKYNAQRPNILSTMYYVLSTTLESVAFKLQYQHMKSKITREVVTKTRALFHPQDWGKVVLSRLSS